MTPLPGQLCPQDSPAWEHPCVTTTRGHSLCRGRKALPRVLTRGPTVVSGVCTSRHPGRLWDAPPPSLLRVKVRRSCELAGAPAAKPCTGWAVRLASASGSQRVAADPKREPPAPCSLRMLGCRHPGLRNGVLAAWPGLHVFEDACNGCCHTLHALECEN